MCSAHAAVLALENASPSPSNDAISFTIPSTRLRTRSQAAAIGSVLDRAAIIDPELSNEAQLPPRRASGVRAAPRQLQSPSRIGVEHYLKQMGYSTKPPSAAAFLNAISSIQHAHSSASKAHQLVRALSEVCGGEVQILPPETTITPGALSTLSTLPPLLEPNRLPCNELRHSAACCTAGDVPVVEKNVIRAVMRPPPLSAYTTVTGEQL